MYMFEWYFKRYLKKTLSPHPNQDGKEHEDTSESADSSTTKMDPKAPIDLEEPQIRGDQNLQSVIVIV